MAMVHRTKDGGELKRKYREAWWKSFWGNIRFWSIAQPVLQYLLVALLAWGMWDYFGGGLGKAVCLVLHVWGLWKLLGALWFQVEWALEHPSNEVGILKSGVQGERIALWIMRLLPGDYHIFPGLRITDETGSSEMDLVILGPTGIFVVEAKNYKGKLNGDWSDHDLYQKRVKESRRGLLRRKYRREVGETKVKYNPLKQVGTHVYRLSRYLKKEGVACWIQGCVWFVNPSLEILVTNRGNISAPVFQVRLSRDRSRSIRRFILSRRQPLSREMLAQAVDALDRLYYED